MTFYFRRIFILAAICFQDNCLIYTFSLLGEEYKIYSLDMLFQFLYSAIMIPMPLSVATELITDCGLDYHPNISCPVSLHCVGCFCIFYNILW